MVTDPAYELDYDRPMQLQGPALASPAAPLNQLLRQGLNRDPDAIAMVSIVRSMSWLELERESNALAADTDAWDCSPATGSRR